VAFLATTLDRLVMGARPFWGGGSGAIRATAIPHPLPSLIRWTLPVLYGGEDRQLPAGLRSWRCDRLAVSSPTPYVLDGEFFDGPADGPLKIETGAVLTYITG